MIITDQMVELYYAKWLDTSSNGDRADVRAGLEVVAPLILAAHLNAEPSWLEPVEFSVDPIDTWHRALQLAQGETGGGDLSLEDLRARATDMLAVLLDPPVIDDV